MRNRISIKLRVTIWYTLLVAVVITACLWLLMSGTRRATDAYVENMLTEAMSSAAREVKYAGGAALLDEDEVSDFGDKVSFSLYSAEGELWQGKWTPFDADFIDGSVCRFEDSSARAYLSQDLLLPFPEGDLWLRGYVSVDTVTFVREEARLIIGYALPAILLIAALGGYLLTRGAFRPVSGISKTAAGIAEGGDLTKRFDTRGKDEIAALAKVFNGMFERLQAAFERERRFTDDAAHELRTPVAVIRASAEDALSGGETEMREALSAILSKSKQMSDMLAQMLALARMDAGRIALEPENVDLLEICRCVAMEMRDRAAEKGVDMTVEGESAAATADQLLLTRLAVILTDNAIKFTPRGGKIRLTAKTDGASAVMEISDTGAGISAEALDKVFERFYQAEASHSQSGSGLGLPMARSIAKLHGGDIALENAENGGLTVRFTLPKKI